MQSLERCQLKEVVAAKPEKLEASGDKKTLLYIDYNNNNNSNIAL